MSMRTRATAAATLAILLLIGLAAPVWAAFSRALMTVPLRSGAKVSNMRTPYGHGAAALKRGECFL